MTHTPNAVQPHAFIPHVLGPDHYSGCTALVEHAYCGLPRSAPCHLVPPESERAADGAFIEKAQARMLAGHPVSVLSHDDVFRLLALAIVAREDAKRLDFVFTRAPGWLARQGHWMLDNYQWAWARWRGFVSDEDTQGTLKQPVVKYSSFRDAIDAEMRVADEEGEDYPVNEAAWKFTDAARTARKGE